MEKEESEITMQRLVALRAKGLLREFWTLRVCFLGDYSGAYEKCVTPKWELSEIHANLYLDKGIKIGLESHRSV